MKEQIKEMYGDVRNAIVHNSAVDFSRGCILSVDFDGVTRELYDDGYRKQSEWISVEDRLPENYKHVIVCDECGNVGEAFHFKEYHFEWVDDENRAFVTHWMPLPGAPKKGGAE